ncbi:hypothetical protein ACPTI2_10835 [Enterococcus faecalis]|uniref:hypothetical protein n=1 Tax=Enterococcus faecalis TaxID=1351 RepID=UPI003CC6A4FB
MNKNSEKQSSWLVYLCLVWGMVTFFVTPRMVKAEESDLVINSQYYKNALTEKIPAANTFIIRNGENTTFEKVSGKISGTTLITGVNDDTHESSVLFHNVGFYEGENVNLKVTVEMLKPYGTDMYLNKSDFLLLKIYAHGVARVTYEFLDDRLQPFELKTTFNQGGLNKWKDLSVVDPENIIENLYTRPDSELSYTLTNNVMTFKGNGDANVRYDDKHKLAITTKKVSKVQFIVKNNDDRSATQGGASDIYYLSQFFPDIEFPEAQTRRLSVQTIANQEVLSEFNQVVPYMKSSNYLKNLSYSINNLSQKQFSIQNVEIKDFYGRNRTDWFEQNVTESGELIISAKPDVLASSEFYDNIYVFSIHNQFIGSAKNPVDKNELNDNHVYRLNYQLKQIINQEEHLVGEGYSDVSFNGQIKLSFVDETGQSILKDQVITGIITDSFDLSSCYPVIDGYYPQKEKTGSNQDLVYFKPQFQHFVHYYKKGLPMKFSLKNAENPLRVSRFTKTRDITIHFSHDAHERIQLIARCGSQKIMLKEYKNVPEEYEDTLTMKAPDSWLDKEVLFYIQSETGRLSSEESRHLVLDDGVKLVLPKTLSFGQQEISGTNKVVHAQNGKEISVNDQSALDLSRWSIKVKEEKPLTSEHGAVLRNALSFFIQGNKYTINSSNQLVWQGSGNASLSKSDSIDLTLIPSYKVGKYLGTLCWTLEEAPN